MFPPRFKMLDVLQDFALLSIFRSTAAWTPSGPPIQISINPPAFASGPIPEGFLSYAFEFSSFPDFAGNNSIGQNELSYTLISNIGDIQGVKPYVRSGGNTQ